MRVCKTGQGQDPQRLQQMTTSASYIVNCERQQEAGGPAQQHEPSRHSGQQRQHGHHSEKVLEWAMHRLERRRLFDECC